MDDRARLDALRRFQRLLDDAFRVPGTRFRVGWDPIIGLVPWAGDVVSGLLACALLLHARRTRVPFIVQLRMLVNVVVDVALGAIPFLGDVADIFWKANARNFALLDRHAGHVRSATAGDWLVVGAAALVLVTIALVPLVVAFWLLQLVAG